MSEESKQRVPLDPESSKQIEDEKPKNDRFPRSIPFIIGNEFCERFCYYGMRAILTLYFVQVLRYNDDQATEAFHLFAMLCYFTPLLGAVIADSFLGKYKTILYISMIYVVGNIVLSFASHLASSSLTMTGLVLIALGTGGIKPCVSAFGGDQFEANQTHLLSKFFALFYLSINLGSLISMFITPIFRGDISCFGQTSCYPLAFGVPALLMVIALLLFIAGSSLYKKLPPSNGNVVVQFIHCIGYGLFRSIVQLFRGKQERPTRPKHFLEYGQGKFSTQLIEDSKAVLSVFLLFVPLPIFWSLYDQQGSRWVLQAQLTSGKVGSLPFSLKADQFQVINPILIVIMIPLFEYVIYPALGKLHLLRKPLQRMSFGGLLAAVAFVCAAFLQFHIDQGLPQPPSEGHAYLQLLSLSKPDTSIQFEGLSPVNTSIVNFDRTFLNSLIETSTLSWTPASINHKQKGKNLAVMSKPVNPYLKLKEIPVGPQLLNFSYISNDNVTTQLSVLVHLNETKSYTLLLLANDTDSTSISTELMIEKQEHVVADQVRVSVFYNLEDYFEDTNRSTAVFELRNGDVIRFAFTVDRHDSWYSYTKYFELDSLESADKLYLDGKVIGQFQGVFANSYKLVVIAVGPKNIQYRTINFEHYQPISMFWQSIQYVVITASEIALSITGLEFSYSQAPASMKSVVSAAWLFTTAMGNLFVVIITENFTFESQAISFLFFAGLMVLDMGLFILLAVFYKPIEERKRHQDESSAAIRNSRHPQYTNETSGEQVS